MATTNTLSDAAIRKAKPGDKPRKLSDGGGLYLELQPNGDKWWWLKDRFEGKEKGIGLGTYPAVTLADARKRRDEARALVAAGTDPSEAGKAEQERQYETPVEVGSSSCLLHREPMTPVQTGRPPPDEGKQNEAPASATGAFERIDGRSFPWTVKAMATLLLVVLLVQGWQVIDRQPWRDLGWPAGLFLLAVAVVIASGSWGILTSRTSIDGRCIRQTWLWPKEVALADITQVKLLHVPVLSWLVVPRLVVRSGSMNLTTFHAADERVLAALRVLAYGGKV